MSPSGGDDSGYAVLRMVGDGVEREIKVWEGPREARRRASNVGCEGGRTTISTLASNRPEWASV